MRDTLINAGAASCISQTLPAPGFTAPSTSGTAVAAPLRSVIGYSISGGENIYGPMDAGFTLGQVCTNSRGACPAGTDTRMCGALHEKVCGTTGLKGHTSATMHMLLSDCGGHAGARVARLRVLGVRRRALDHGGRDARWPRRLRTVRVDGR